MHTLEQLNAFICVYEHGSYSSAAKILGKSRTTVREHIVAYEDTLGYSLFSIDGRKALPTDKASQLYFRAKVVEKQNRELFVYSRALFEEEVHTLNIVHDVIVPLPLMAKVHQAVQKDFPGLVIQWLHRTRQEALDMLEQEEAQFAVMPNRSQVFVESQVDWKAIGHVTVKCYAGRHSPLTGKEVSLNELQCETQYLTENLQKLNVGFTHISPKLSVISNNDLLCELLKHDGWAALPESCVEPYVASGELVELRLDKMVTSLQLGLNLFYSHGSEKNKVCASVIRWFIHYSHELLL